MGDFGDEINCEDLFDGLPTDGGDLNLFDAGIIDSSPEAAPFTIDEIEQMLMKDDDVEGANVVVEDALTDFQIPDVACFFSDFLLDSPARSDRSGQVTNASDGKDSSNDSEEDKVDAAPHQSCDKDEDFDDPISKKRKRQIRNRDAAMRSRERKKMYVKDLEMKSKYYEAECKRLGMLLQYHIAENQALRFSLQSSKAYDASRTKQESAVLLLESLLLGSLLWFLAITCLLSPGQFQPTLAAFPKGSEEDRYQQSLIQRRTASKKLVSLSFLSLMMGKKCQASRWRMKAGCLVEVL